MNPCTPAPGGRWIPYGPKHVAWVRAHRLGPCERVPGLLPPGAVQHGVPGTPGAYLELPGVPVATAPGATWRSIPGGSFAEIPGPAAAILPIGKAAAIGIGGAAAAGGAWAIGYQAPWIASQIPVSVVGYPPAPPVKVPEPASALLFVLAVVALLIVRKRR